MLHVVYRKSIYAHHLGKSQGCSKLGKLSGLQSQRPQHKPRPRAFYLVGIENGGKEQKQQCTIKYIGKHIIKTVVEHQ